jgi:hypothetical protein
MLLFEHCLSAQCIVVDIVPLISAQDNLDMQKWFWNLKISKLFGIHCQMYENFLRIFYFVMFKISRHFSAVVRKLPCVNKLTMIQALPWCSVPLPWLLFEKTVVET